jgi:hypothetical protein
MGGWWMSVVAVWQAGSATPQRQMAAATLER